MTQSAIPIVPGRSAGIDMLRGALVLGVIAGHCAELVARGSFLAWIGTGIRMPLFLGLAGYLFDLERARAAPAWMLMRRSWRRLIVPWILASCAYLLLADQLEPGAIVMMLVRPSFHLWFVPVLLTFMTIATLTRQPSAILFAWATLTSVAAMYALGVGHGVGHHPAWLPDRRYFVYPVFFFYGLWVARRPRDRGRVMAAIGLAVIGVIWWASLYVAPDPAGEVAALLIWGLALIYLLPNVRLFGGHVPTLAAVGRDSLFCYLWHPLVFTLWLAAGGRGWAILVPTLLVLMALRAMLAHRPRLAALAGLAARVSTGTDRMPITPAVGAA